MCSAALQPTYKWDCASPRLANSRPSLRRSIKLCGCNLADRQAAAERAAARVERVVSASLVCAVSCMFMRGSRPYIYIAVAVRVMRRDVVRPRVVGIRTRGCASDGVRHAERTPRATAVLTCKVARRAIAHRSARRPDGCQRARWPVRDMTLPPSVGTTTKSSSYFIRIPTRTVQYFLLVPCVLTATSSALCVPECPATLGLASVGRGGCLCLGLSLVIILRRG